MKRLCLLLALLLALTPLGALAEKYDSLPPVFNVSVEVQKEEFGRKQRYLIREMLVTTNETVNQELKAIGDGYVDTLYASMPDDPTKNPARNNRLDVEVLWYRTGQSWLSTLTFARMTVKRAQTQCPFTTRTYDLETGERILLTDVFSDDSKAWGVLADGVRSHLEYIFPAHERDSAAIDRLTSREALEQADFTLSGMELTLHYPAGEVVADKTGIAHVRFFYPQFEGMMTDRAAQQTDNSRWKFVAITCDDGPNYTQSAKALNSLRRGGVRATYFTVGKVAAEYPDILQRMSDENHVIANHSYSHKSGYALSEKGRLESLAKVDALYEELIGVKTMLFRCPGGTYPPWIEAGIDKPIIQWSVDTYDYRGRKANVILNSVKQYVREGDIILMHDTTNHMNEAVPMVAEYLWNNGYMPVTVDELMASCGVTMQPAVVYHRCQDGDTTTRKDSNLN